MQSHLYRAQRYSAMLLAPFVFAHLSAVLYARFADLSGAEIFAMMNGRNEWLLFYTGFVLVVAVHAPIGLWQVLRSVPRLPGWLSGSLSLGFAASVLMTGMAGVFAMLQ